MYECEHNLSQNLNKVKIEKSKRFIYANMTNSDKV